MPNLRLKLPRCITNKRTFVTMLFALLFAILVRCATISTLGNDGAIQLIPCPVVLREERTMPANVVERQRTLISTTKQKKRRAQLRPCSKSFLGEPDECLDHIPNPRFAEFHFLPKDHCQKYTASESLLDAAYDFSESGCPWLQGDGVSTACQYYCYYSERYGFARISQALWKAAQKGEHAIWISTEDDSDRGAENREGFQDYKILRGMQLGRVLEIGSGPFTQTKTIIAALKESGNDPHIEAIHVSDPGVPTYLKHTKHCSYKSGTMAGYRTTAHAFGGEDLPFDREFDSVVSINVIEHCRDAFEYIERLHQSLKIGGILIFHDRVYDKFLQILDPEEHAEEVAGLHPLRIKKRLLDVLLSPERYELLFYSETLTYAMELRAMTQIPEEPIWFIARKVS